MADDRCPFCGEPVIQRYVNGAVFRCGTSGPDINGEYSTGRTCDIVSFTRRIRELEQQLADAQSERDALVDRLAKLSAWLDDASANAQKVLLSGGVAYDWALLEAYTVMREKMDELAAERQGEVMADAKCPRCGSSATQFRFSPTLKLPFQDRRCSRDECGLPCNLWEEWTQLAAAQAERDYHRNTIESTSRKLGISDELVWSEGMDQRVVDAACSIKAEQDALAERWARLGDLLLPLLIHTTADTYTYQKGYFDAIVYVSQQMDALASEKGGER